MSALASPTMRVRPRVLHGEVWVARGGVILLAVSLFVFLALPLALVLIKTLENRDGQFVGGLNFIEYFRTPALVDSIGNSLSFALMTTAIVLPLAFGFAYAIQRSCIPFKWLWRQIALAPILAPSLLAAISFLYLFGNQGWLKGALEWAGLQQIYGLPGMTMAMVFAAFPHAVMILLASLSLSDARLYEAADALGTSQWRKFITITLPGAKYGLISAAMVVFTASVAEFGIPKVIGGNYNVLAVDIYKQVVGQQNFQMGAVVSLLLLLPAVVAFVIDHAVQRRAQSQMGSRSVPYRPQPAAWRDRLMLAYVIAVAAAMLLVMGMALFGSLATFWPYNLKPTLQHYIYGLEEAGVDLAYWNSLKLAAGSALVGTIASFAGAYWLEKTKGVEWLRPLVRFQAMLPMAVPGLVLGIAYIFFFNNPANPMAAIYGSMAILIASTVVHFYSSSYLTATTALKALDSEFEAVSASLKVPFYRTFWRVTVPVCLPSVIDIARYYFINAMTTVSAVVFLYSPGTLPASVSLLHLDEAGNIGAAAAMGLLIVITSSTVALASFALEWWLVRRTQAWRQTART